MRILGKVEKAILIKNISDQFEVLMLQSLCATINRFFGAKITGLEFRKKSGGFEVEINLECWNIHWCEIEYEINNTLRRRDYEIIHGEWL